VLDVSRKKKYISPNVADMRSLPKFY